MPILQSYSKKDFFEHLPISDFSELLHTLNSLHRMGYYFRGMSNSLWKLYTSMQREWINRDIQKIIFDKNRLSLPPFTPAQTTKFAQNGCLTSCQLDNMYHDFIREYLNYVKNSNNLMGKIDSQCKIVNDVSIFSALQHYGAPTPFLDFTSKPEIALFFATQTNNGNENFSIYALKAGGNLPPFSNELMRFSDPLANATPTLGEIAQEEGLDPNKVHDDSMEFKVWRSPSLLVFEETEEWYMRISNPRSDLQSGLFIYNSSPTRPLEDAFVNNQNLTLPKIKCFDISKELLPAVQAFTETVGCTKTTLGLDTTDIGKSIFDDFLKYKGITKP
jgi:hypothetical protein